MANDNVVRYVRGQYRCKRPGGERGTLPPSVRERGRGHDRNRRRVEHTEIERCLPRHHRPRRRRSSRGELPLVHAPGRRFRRRGGAARPGSRSNRTCGLRKALSPSQRRQVWVRSRSLSRVSGEDSANRFLKVVEDITEIRRAREALRRRARRSRSSTKQRRKWRQSWISRTSYSW